MKAMRSGGRVARRFGVRFVVASLVCALALAGVSAWQRGASAQEKSAQGGAKSVSSASKVAPATAQSRGGFKESGPKALRTPGGDVSPQVLGCSNATSAISFGQTVSGTLQAGDCVLGDGSLFDAYTFSGTSGQQVIITMNSAAFDTYLYLMRPGETTVSNDPSVTIQDDDSGGGTNSRISFTLASTGTYTIIANAFDNTGQGAYTLLLSGGSTCTPVTTPISPNTTAQGTLASGDCTLDDGSFYDVFTFSGTAGQQVSVTMTASFDTFLFLVAPDGDEIARDDNGAGGTNSRIPANTSDLARLPQTGTYRIVANSFASGVTGSYSVTLTVGGTNCPSTTIAANTTANGSLAVGDCRLPADASFIDVYTFSGTQNQTVNVAMNSAAFDSYLFLLDPAGSVLAQDDNGGGGTNARIPAGSGSFTLPSTGTYTIYANSSTSGLTGAYTLTLNASQVCTYSLTSASRTVSAGGGTFTADAFTTQAGCPAPSVTSNAAFITPGTATVNASGQGTFSYTVAANSSTSARSGTLSVDGQTFTVNQDAACAVEVFPSFAPFTQSGGTGRLSVFPTGQCSWTVSTAASWIHITTPAGGATGTGTGRVRFSVDPNGGTTTRTGTINVGTAIFTVTETSAGTTPQVQFSSAAYSVNESDASKSVTITVSRTGDTAGAVTVDYSTVDDPAPVPCDPNAKDGSGNPFPKGKAYARCDYATTIDTLTFNPGETVKTFLVPLINDTHFEGAETFNVALSNPQGALLGTPATATVTISDDETAQATTNPSRQAAFFVRQQYLDFLNREPDPDGFALWTGLFNGCSNQDNFDPNNPAHFCDRVAISSGFFLSQEFQLKGFFVFLYWKVSFATQSNPNYYPEYGEIVPDMRRVTGSTANEVFAKRNDFAEDWVNRPAFKARYDSLTNAQFVDTLLSNVGATMTNADPNSGQTRNSLVAALDAATKTRAEVLRIIVESQEVNSLQFNSAFVSMQYYGYLRRTPDPSGYGDWFGFLSAHPGDFRTMVFGFVNSDEYYLRFGPNVRQ